ncbi:hypothetical protein DMUE_4257 [Dictyocoela muelleri]|nr:hypothetical protein DMUE_4257 [Dictyocoela muelleri]
MPTFFRDYTRFYIKNDKEGLLIDFKSKFINVPLPKNKVRGKICLTNQCTNEVYKFLRNLHVELLHPGVRVFEQTLKKFSRVQGMRKVISKICNECIECNIEKDYNVIKRLPSYEMGYNNINDFVGIDIKGPIQMCHYQTNK